MNFAKYIVAHMLAKFKLASFPDDVSLVCFLRVWFS